MGVKELPLLQAVECCTPLAMEPLPESDAVVLSERFAALSDPVRLRLVSLLANADGGAVCVCDLTEPVGRGPSMTPSDSSAGCRSAMLKLEQQERPPFDLGCA